MRCERKERSLLEERRTSGELLGFEGCLFVSAVSEKEVKELGESVDFLWCEFV